MKFDNARSKPSKKLDTSSTNKEIGIIPVCENIENLPPISLLCSII